MKIVCRNAHNPKCNHFINYRLILSYIFLSKKELSWLYLIISIVALRYIYLLQHCPNEKIT